MDGIEDLRDRGDLFLRVLGEQDTCKEMALMAKEAGITYPARGYQPHAPSAQSGAATEIKACDVQIREA